MATCMDQIGTWESCLQLHTAMNLDIQVTDPTACHGGLFSWMTRPSVSSWGVEHHLVIIVLHWEQCSHLLWCGASHKSGHCKRHRKVHVLIQKRCVCLPRISKAAQTSLAAVVEMQIQRSIQWKPKDWHI